MLYKQVDFLLKKRSDKLSLFNGIGADILCLAEEAILTSRTDIKNTCYKKLDYLIEHFGECKSVNLSDGIIGLLFLLLYLEKHKLIQTEPGFYDEFDNVISLFVEHSYRIGNYDLLNGILGAGIYYLEIVDVFYNKSIFLHNIISKLKNLIINKTYWRYTIEKSKDKCGDIVNLGFLHGMPSIFSFFMTCIQKDILNTKDATLIYNMLKEFKRYQVNMNTNSFPNYVVFKNRGNIIIPQQKTRLGYCYGDLGIITMYLNAYETFKDPDFSCIANRMLVKIANRISVEKISDDYFCHGASSIFYFINKFKRIATCSCKNLFQHTENKYLKRMLSLDFNQYPCSILKGYNGIFLSLLSPSRSVALDKILLLK